MCVCVAAQTGKMINYYAAKPLHRSCSANLLQDVGSFEQLKSSAPLPLTERYYQCVMTRYGSMFEALGLSMGNADLIVAVCSMVVLGLVSMWHRSLGFEDAMFATPAKTEVSISQLRPH